ncbi:MAG: MmcQ/YjbR family DNA-binding protein [Acidobacteriota bacterium]|nr:MmcQ/YjbR family DNA-binding protein [Acidobacteriota bacterium]
MDVKAVKAFCLALPGTTEDLKWENDLCFLVGNKMYAVLGITDEPVSISFKTTPEWFDLLITRDGIDPAPYVGRYKWVRLARLTALDSVELQEYLRESYKLIFAKLPARIKREVGGC